MSSSGNSRRDYPALPHGQCHQKEQQEVFPPVIQAACAVSRIFRAALGEASRWKGGERSTLLLLRSFTSSPHLLFSLGLALLLLQRAKVSPLALVSGSVPLTAPACHAGTNHPQ
eukprot:5276992-Amphidinium_carterae.1